MKNAILWLFMLSKRLFKKPSFWIVLLLIPALVMGYSSVAKQESGILRIALVQLDPADPVATQIVGALESSPLIQFTHATRLDATEALQTGKVDAVWIFPEDMIQRIEAHIADRSDALVHILEREQSVATRLAREKLSAVLYRYCARQIYLQYARDFAPQLEAVSDGQLMEFWENTQVQGSLFAFYDADGNIRDANGHYLTAPIRGLLAVVTAFAAVITAVYFENDKKRGMFQWIPEKKRILVELLYHLVTMLCLLPFVVLALVLSGLSVHIGRELICAFAYAILCALFAMFLYRVFRCGKWLTAILPALLIVFLTACPVFFDFPELRGLCIFLPPGGYIRAAVDRGGIIIMALSTILYGCGILALEGLKKAAANMKKQ